MKVLDALKANKEPVLMILGTVGVVADVCLAVRNGVRMKRKLEELDQVKEDISNIDIVVECAPELAEIFGLTAVSIGCFWFARKINIDRIISIGSVAAMYQQRCENQEKVVKGELGDDVYTELEEKVTAENAKSAAKKRSKVTDARVDHGPDNNKTFFMNELTGVGHDWTEAGLVNCFNKWKKDMTSEKCNWSPRDDEWVPASTLYHDYFDEKYDDKWNLFGWTWSDIRTMQLYVTNPPVTIYTDEYDEDAIPFRLSVIPRLMPTE